MGRTVRIWVRVEEEQLLARAMQEHMHLKHIHNALEFADVREGAPYERSNYPRRSFESLRSP
jgi:hypothetical protein